MRVFSPEGPPLIRLLQAASQGREDLALGAFDDARVRWAVETGLGPLLFRATNTDPEAPSSPLWPLLRGADLTAQLLAGVQLDAMAEIIDACRRLGYIPTLLKGISLRDQHYPAPHIRVMRDIDFLVPDAARPFVESTLFELGYSQQSTTPPDSYETHHHSMPFFHPRRGVWVEVHRALSSPKSMIGTDRVLDIENVRGNLVLSDFHGRQVTRLTDELQVVYIASHWARDFKVLGAMIPMLDMIYLLKNGRHTLCWERILDWMPGSAAAAHLYLVLTYLHKYGLVGLAPGILEELAWRQRSLGEMNLRILHTLIDQYFVDGKRVGPLLSARNLRIIWKTLLLPGAPFRNFVRVPRNLLRARSSRRSGL